MLQARYSPGMPSSELHFPSQSRRAWPGLFKGSLMSRRARGIRHREGFCPDSQSAVKSEDGLKLPMG